MLIALRPSSRFAFLTVKARTKHPCRFSRSSRFSRSLTQIIGNARGRSGGVVETGASRNSYIITVKTVKTVKNGSTMRDNLFTVGGGQP